MWPRTPQKQVKITISTLSSAIPKQIPFSLGKKHLRYSRYLERDALSGNPSASSFRSQQQELLSGTQGGREEDIKAITPLTSLEITR